MSLPVHYEREPCYMSELDEARTLMDAGDRDLSALRGMEDTSVFADEIVGFHVQQAAEKFLKAWLVLWSEPYPLTHNLARLLTLLQEKTPAAAQFRDLNEYTAYAVQFRYDAMESESNRKMPSVWKRQPRRCSPAFGSVRQQVQRRLAEVEGT